MEGEKRKKWNNEKEKKGEEQWKECKLEGSEKQTMKDNITNFRESEGNKKDKCSDEVEGKSRRDAKGRRWEDIIMAVRKGDHN